MFKRLEEISCYLNNDEGVVVSEELKRRTNLEKMPEAFRECFNQDVLPILKALRDNAHTPYFTTRNDSRLKFYLENGMWLFTIEPLQNCQFNIRFSIRQQIRNEFYELNYFKNLYEARNIDDTYAPYQYRFTAEDIDGMREACQLFKSLLAKSLTEDRTIVTGTINSTHNSPDGLAINFRKKDKELLPLNSNDVQPIQLELNGKSYQAKIHHPDKGGVWVSPVCYFEEEKITLSSILLPCGFRAKDKIQIAFNGTHGIVLNTQQNSNTQQEAQEKNMSHIPLNTILFGPPGTGKTYHTTEHAVKIADPEWFAEQSDLLSDDELRKALKHRYDELLEQKRIVFTTFHQSFAYEDFIEGIRATTDEDSGALKYEIQDGIFKQLCDKACSRDAILSEESIDLSGRRFWKMSLGNTKLEDDDYIYQECLENNYVLLGWGGNIDFSGCNNKDSIKEKFEQEHGEVHDFALASVHRFKNEIQKGDLIVISDGNRKFRAIAEITGEYMHQPEDDRDDYHQARSVKWLRRYEPSQPVEALFNKNLTQKTLYELKGETIVLKRMAELLAPTGTTEQALKPHVIVIDEINRGNISRIFGELITLLEPSKRKGEDEGHSVTLPYSKTPFTIPNNLYVVGTMNTADKSLAQLDLALRRRFSFIEMLPNPKLLQGIEVFGVEIDELLSTINQRIEVLLDQDHMIGHSYFMQLPSLESEEDRQQELKRIFKENILPLLQEYFFDDFERIGWVLNDPKKSDECRFITQGGDNSIEKLFGAEVAGQLSDRRYRLNESAFENPEAYLGIIG
ncbi:AAA family ATPase [Dongshaea marina]|uniref:AAA family ATPase n=1 Tax=Dongshaea marina TaxID=2047966 RepID=UPI000D3ECCF3|nr:AAA family ATPase [Dongshaea marina]